MQARLATPVGTRAYLRIYWGTDECPDYGYHNAMVHLADTTDLDAWTFMGEPADHAGDPRWPVKCDHCKAPVPETATRQVFRERIYDTPSGKLEPGCLFWADWFGNDDGGCSWHDRDCDGRHLHAVLPNGRMWDIDGRASNCTMPDDRLHRCWVRHGEPPNVTVDKAGATCAAGAGSIQAGDYHGFLHNGQFT